jgi:hypothetical protein
VFPEIVAGPLFTVTVTGRLELAVGGVIVTLAPLLYVWFGIVVKALMVLFAAAITTFWLTGVAALQLLLPGCEAVMLAVPAPKIVTTLLERLTLVELEL